MRFLCEKLDKLRTGWNERPLTEDDFYRLCRRLRLRFNEMPLSVEGFYYRAKGIDWIVISTKLSGNRRLAVMFHELGHFLFHAPDHGATANFHGVGRPTRKECEADVFALCAILPRGILIRSSPEELFELGFDEDIVVQRVAVYRRYGL
jgi:Zn-dependent peptidase ImmA (M78 family)